MEKNGKTNIQALEQKAIKAALNEDWKVAIEANTELLEKDPVNLKAKMRLGRALLQSKEFKQAESIFKEILKKDPINKIAKKNYELAKSKKLEKIKATSTKKFLNEPGTYEEAMLEVEGKLTADSFEKGDEFELRVNKKSVTLTMNGKKVGQVVTDIVQRLNAAKKKKADISCEFKKGNDKVITVIFRSDIPVLKASKQEVKPYIKNNNLVEDDSEIETED